MVVDSSRKEKKKRKKKKKEEAEKTASKDVNKSVFLPFFERMRV